MYQYSQEQLDHDKLSQQYKGHEEKCGRCSSHSPVVVEEDLSPVVVGEADENGKEGVLEAIEMTKWRIPIL